jgi:cytochrome c oxidase subunit II
MRQKIFWSVVCMMLPVVLSSCCVNCEEQPAEGQPAYAPENPPDPPPSGEIVNGVRVIKMTAKKYEFDPSVVIVNQADKVRLQITSTDVTQGLALKEYKIDSKIEPGKTAMVEFPADKTVSFDFHCSVFCGLGHFGMKGKLIVQTK